MVNSRVTEEALKNRQHYDKLKIGIEMDTIKFESVIRDKA